MVDNAWRDSFRVKALPLRREVQGEEKQLRELTGLEDNSSLLEIEKKANLSKKSGGDGLFAGTYFEAPTNNPNASNSMMKSVPIQVELDEEEEAAEVAAAAAAAAAAAHNQSIDSKGRRGKSIYDRAQHVLETFAERLSSGGESGLRRKSSKEEMVDRDKTNGSGDGAADRRKSTAPQRVKSVVAKLSRATSRRKKGSADGQGMEEDREGDTPSDTMYATENPRFSKEQQTIEE